jgi:hypothetical protein
MLDLIIKILEVSKGVLIEVQNLKPVRQIKLKDLFKYNIYLYVHENKVYIYPTENITENIIYSDLKVDSDIVNNGAIIFTR